MKKRPLTVLLLAALFAGMLMGCGDKEPEEQVSWVGMCTMGSEEDAFACSVENVLEGGILLDIAQQKDGYLLLLEEAGETVLLTLDQSFRELQRSPTMSGAQALLPTEEGLFLYVPDNETPGIYLDGSLYLPMEADGEETIQLLYSRGELFTCTDSRLYCGKTEIPWQSMEVSEWNIAQYYMLAGLALWDGGVYVSTRANVKPEYSDLYEGFDGQIGSSDLFRVRPGRQELLENDSMTSHPSGDPQLLASTGQNFYCLDANGCIWVTFWLDDIVYVVPTARALYQLSGEDVPYSQARRMLALADGSILLLCPDRLALVKAV